MDELKDNELKRRGQLVSETIVLVSDTRRLSDVAVAIKNLIEYDLWRSFIVPTSGELVTYDSDEWLKFVRTQPAQGLGMTTNAIEEIAKTHSDELHKTVKRMNATSLNPLNDTDIETTQELGKRGGKGNKGVDISTPLTAKSLGAGTSRNYRIALLKRDAPDIAERVIDGDISAAGGMRELNKRLGLPEKKRTNVNLLDASSARDTLIKWMPSDVLHELTDLLNDWRENND